MDRRKNKLFNFRRLLAFRGEMLGFVWWGGYGLEK